VDLGHPLRFSGFTLTQDKLLRMQQGFGEAKLDPWASSLLRAVPKEFSIA